MALGKAAPGLPQLLVPSRLPKATLLLQPGAGLGAGTRWSRSQSHRGIRPAGPVLPFAAGVGAGSHGWSESRGKAGRALPASEALSQLLLQASDLIKPQTKPGVPVPSPSRSRDEDLVPGRMSRAVLPRGVGLGPASPRPLPWPGLSLLWPWHRNPVSSARGRVPSPLPGPCAGAVGGGRRIFQRPGFPLLGAGENRSNRTVFKTPPNLFFLSKLGAARD